MLTFLAGGELEPANRLRNLRPARDNGVDRAHNSQALVHRHRVSCGIVRWPIVLPVIIDAHRQYEIYAITRTINRLQMRLDELRAPRVPASISLHRILHAVMAETGTTREELISRRRAHRILHPTMAAMYVAAELTSASLSEIGRWLGNRDHGTVLSATHRVPQMCQADPAFDALIKKLIAKLQS